MHTRIETNKKPENIPRLANASMYSRDLTLVAKHAAKRSMKIPGSLQSASEGNIIKAERCEAKYIRDVSRLGKQVDSRSVRRNESEGYIRRSWVRYVSSQ